MNVVSENAGPVALLEATAEARTLIEELTGLAEELKGRDERDERRAGGAAPDRGPWYQAHHETRALSREEIARSADLQRRYVAEYASMLRASRDRELAKEAARVNMSALLFGQPRIVPLEGRVNVRQLQNAIG